MLAHGASYNPGMRQDVASLLLRINLEFYQTFAGPFAATRRRLQPGVVRALRSVQAEASVLDLGCGAGELAGGLARRGHHGPYLGLDASSEMLAAARQRVTFSWARFQLADLSQPDWPARLGECYDQVFLLSVIHHIPGHEHRVRLLEQVSTGLAAAGSLTISAWDFAASPRLARRVLPWGNVGLSESEVEPGDYLLDWRHGGHGLRYIHLFTHDDLQALAAQVGFVVVDRYRSDGEGGRLGLYQVWKIGREESGPQD